MNDLKSMKDLLIKAPSTTYPSLIMCNDTLPEDPCPVLTILLKIGSQGFMVAVPGEEEVMEAVDAHLQIIRSDPDTLLTEFRGDLPAVAGRTNAGVTSVILLDVPESMVGCFKRTPTRLTNWPNNLYRFTNEYVSLVKPRVTELTQLADEFVEMLKENDEDAFGTAQEEADAAEEEFVIPPGAHLVDLEEPGAEEEQAGFPREGRLTPRSMTRPKVKAKAPAQPARAKSLSTQAALQKELEEARNMIAELKNTANLQMRPGVGGGASSRSPTMFEQEAAKVGLTPEQIESLRKIAGEPPRVREPAHSPSTIGMHERKAIAAPKSDAAGDVRDIQLEAVEEPLPEGAEFGPEAGGAKLLSAINVQSQALMQLMQAQQPKESDPLLKMLGGGDSSGGSSGGLSGGVRGCLAREVFLNSLKEEPAKLPPLIRRALAETFNRPSSDEDSTLIFKYRDRRMPLGNMKLLTYVTHLAAEMWAAAERKEHDVVHSLIGRLLIFADQTAISSGKSDFAWMLTGLPEPEWEIYTAQSRPRVRPFSPLCPATWVNTNLAYVKDVDFMSQKINTVFAPAGKAPYTPPAPGGPAGASPKGKAKQRRKNRYGKKEDEEKEE